MRAVLGTLALALACGPLQAQTAFEKPKEENNQKAAKTKPDKARPAQPDHRRHSSPRRDERPVERQTPEGPVKLDRVRPESQRPSSPPSPAEQQQRQQFEQRQRQQAQPPQPQTQRTVQCSARPVCGGAGYGRCAAVSQTYPGSTLQSGRREIVQACIAANTPDSCNCTPQCASVARCSIF